MERAALIREILKLHRQMNRVMRQYEPDAWKDLNLTIAQLKSLFVITNQGSTNSRKLAVALGVTPANVTGIVDRLVDQGLVSRTENPEDRRMLLLRATGKGEVLAADLRERTIGHISKVLARMSVDELATLSQGLASLVKAAKAHEGENEDEHD